MLQVIKCKHIIRHILDANSVYPTLHKSGYSSPETKIRHATLYYVAHNAPQFASPNSEEGLADSERYWTGGVSVYIQSEEISLFWGAELHVSTNLLHACSTARLVMNMNPSRARIKINAMVSINTSTQSLPEKYWKASFQCLMVMFDLVFSYIHVDMILRGTVAKSNMVRMPIPIRPAGTLELFLLKWFTSKV